ncbi:MAG: RNA polymerase sigma factor [Myxococcaceae bacterium]
MTVDAATDAELMAQTARGNQRAFGLLFDRYQQSIVHFAFRFVGSRARAEELAQDIFMKLYRTASRYKPSASFKTFLFRVATNHCLNEVRRGEYHLETGGPEAEAQLDVRADAAPSPHDVLQAKHLERLVHEGLANMSERERAAFSMCRFEGMAYRDIAEALSASEAAVKSLIHRATLVMANKMRRTS